MIRFKQTNLCPLLKLESTLDRKKDWTICAPPPRTAFFDRCHGNMYVLHCTTLHRSREHWIRDREVHTHTLDRLYDVITTRPTYVRCLSVYPTSSA